MTRISFSDLEFARKDPKGFAKSITSQGQSSSRFSKIMAWQLAVYHYHKEKDDLQSALDYFEKMYHKNFMSNPANNKEYDRLLSMLNDYSKDHKRNKLTYFEHKKRISVPINSKLRLGGELPLIDMNLDGGYSIFFFSNNLKWEGELKFPIIQYFAAKVLFNVELSDVKVGIFDLNNHKHMHSTFMEDEVNEALKELTQIGNSILTIIK
jgi:hypothetical protein